MIQLALTVYGIYVLVSGKFAIPQHRQILGWRARVLGVLCLLCLPVAFVIGLFVGVLISMKVIEPPKFFFVADLVIVVADVLLVFLLSKKFWADQERERLLQQQQQPAQENFTSAYPGSNNPFA